MSERAKTSGVVRRAEDAGLTDVAAGKGARTQVLLGPDDGAPNFAMRRFVMETGGGMPLHTNEVEHEQYVLTGRAKVRIGKTEHEVTRGSCLYIPAGVPHSYEVVEGPFEFLCMVPNREDRIQIRDKDGC